MGPEPMIKTDLIDKAYTYKKRNTSFYSEVKDVNAYCTSLKVKYHLDTISLRNLLLIEYIPMIGFFFMLVILILHSVSLWFSSKGFSTSIDVAVGYPIFMLVQYLSIVYLLYLERRYSIEHKSRKNLGSFANIFLVLTVIQFISDSPMLLSTLFQVNLYVLLGIIALFLVWVVYKEIQKE